MLRSRIGRDICLNTRDESFPCALISPHESDRLNLRPRIYLLHDRKKKNRKYILLHVYEVFFDDKITQMTHSLKLAASRQAADIPNGLA